MSLMPCPDTARPRRIGSRGREPLRPGRAASVCGDDFGAAAQLRDAAYTIPAPELLEVVIFADRRLHDVDDDTAHVHQYPLSGLLPLAAEDFAPAASDLILDVARQ